MTSSKIRTSAAKDTAGPFGDYAGRFRAHLESQNYSRCSIVDYERCIRLLGRLIDENGIELKELTATIAAELVVKSGWRPRRPQHPAFMAKTFINYLAELGVAKLTPAPAEVNPARAILRRAYEDYLCRQRGLSKISIQHCWHYADRFLEFRFGSECDALHQITPGDIIAFLQQLVTRSPPVRDTGVSSNLRSFFQYLFKSGHTATNLAQCVPSVAHRYQARLPRHLAPEQVKALITAVKADTSIGRRNYAMILLLARLGLRAPEVVAMQLDDIDWRAGEIIVRGKGQLYDRMPLPPDVGEALADYVRHDRVAASRALFVTSRAPHRPFCNGRALNVILKAAFARIGLAAPCPYVGSSVLRHSLATNLIRQGASLLEIGDMLRHRSRLSTLIYAKLDIEGLRSIAQPWPITGDGR